VIGLFRPDVAVLVNEMFVLNVLLAEVVFFKAAVLLAVVLPDVVLVVLFEPCVVVLVLIYVVVLAVEVCVVVLVLVIVLVVVLVITLKVSFSEML